MKGGLRVATVGVITAVVAAGALSSSGSGIRLAESASADQPSKTTTPIKHLVVVFQENVSFDHYFATYPKAANPNGEPSFTAAANTPVPNGLSGPLLTVNPNASNPQRLDRSQAVTCDQNHEYTAEQSAFDHGLADKFVETTGNGGTGCDPRTVMNYYDGNTVTAMWNYAQHFAMSDNNYNTSFGPSTPGVFDLVTGNTFGATCGTPDAVYGSVPPCPAGVGAAGPATPQGPGTVYGDNDPRYDVCSKGSTIGMGGRNVGDLLNSANLSWGWFEGGFSSPGYVPGKPSTFNAGTVCTSTHTNVAGSTQKDYSAHHQPFQYYPQTSNPQHLPPTSVAAIGHQDQANHQYDLSDFWAAANSRNLPAVSYLKAPRYEDGHAGYSDPLDEQRFIVDTINGLQKLPEWSSTAVVITYDDSDGWYDHVVPPVVNQSQTALDTFSNPNQCGANPSKVLAGQQARCGYGPRLPLLVISPYAHQNTVHSGLTDQSSVLRFVEDNWSLARVGSGSTDAIAGSIGGLFDFSRHHDGKLVLSDSTGQPTNDEDPPNGNN